ncbi:hypothetical protein GIV52_15580 [Pseudomonas syringae]|uniref:Uncharacterized protein n=1 Tax=Pseudomonas syringae TaxID=317 RepID=A0A9Q4A6F4_PSESX|nr:hypothetical protein [Pseudomonas syringae]MCF5474136.1 hypothetical protein [Pseudomonas syringae]MCF5481134.1 hypothetical protein [Pseudomonas syringae]MCF5488272.1 hypothetical protein [Pseudomonas syringae]MCF5495536.1 hypothetical protein [Pseudomonas syringae]
MTKQTKKARFDGFFFVWSKVFRCFGYVRAIALAKVSASTSESHDDCCSFARGSSRINC